MCFNYDVFKDRSSLTLSMRITNRSQSTVPLEPMYQMCKILGRLSRGISVWLLYLSTNLQRGKSLDIESCCSSCAEKRELIFMNNLLHESIS